MSTIALRLQAVLARALAQLPEPPPADFSAPVTAAADTRFGDYQSNAAMTLAKLRRTNPRALAAQIVDLLKTDAELASISQPPEIAGAGFINFRLQPDFLAAELSALDADAQRLGVPVPEKALRVVIDLSGPNIAKPMHVGHLRSTIIGDCLARVARFLGHEVITDNHLGDWGTQFGRIIFGWWQAEARNKEEFERALISDPLAELVRMYQEVDKLIKKEEDFDRYWNARSDKIIALEEQNAAAGIVENAETVWARAETLISEPTPESFYYIVKGKREKPVTIIEQCRIELVKLQSGDPENLAIWQRCVDLSRAELDRIYAELDVHFDYQFGESHFNPQLAPLVERLEQSGIAELSEGALVVFFRSPGDDPKLADRPAIIRKRDGAYNYATTDIATYEQRVNEFKGDALWYIVGSPQTLHFEQINAITRRMGYTVPLTHIPFGSILGEDRKIMRTRSGENVALRDLLDEAVERARKVVEEKNADQVNNAGLSEADKAEIARKIGLGAVKYAELSQHRMTDYIFSWERMLSFQGNTAPYLQNAYVRIRSIFRRGGLDADAVGASGSAAFSLTEAAERELAKKLAQFGEAVPAVLEDFRPNLLANYLYELAGTFHSFFEACPVLKSEGVQRETRLALCRVTARVLQRGLGLLGIETPERM